MFEEVFNGVKDIPIEFIGVSYQPSRSFLLFGNYSDTRLIHDKDIIRELKQSDPPPGSMYPGVAQFRSDI